MELLLEVGKLKIFLKRPSFGLFFQINIEHTFLNVVFEMTMKIIKQVNLSKEIERCTNNDGVMTKIPVFNSIRYVNDELVGELDGYVDPEDTVDYFNRQVNKQKYMN